MKYKIGDKFESNNDQTIEIVKIYDLAYMMLDEDKNVIWKTDESLGRCGYSLIQEPKKVPPPKGTILKVWDSDPNDYCYWESGEEFDGHGRIKAGVAYWYNFEIVRQ